MNSGENVNQLYKKSLYKFSSFYLVLISHIFRLVNTKYIDISTKAMLKLCECCYSSFFFTNIYFTCALFQQIFDHVIVVRKDAWHKVSIYVVSYSKRLISHFNGQMPKSSFIFLRNITSAAAMMKITWEWTTQPYWVKKWNKILAHLTDR